MSDPKHLYWDACVFIAYLNDETAAYGHYIDHIGQYLAEAKKGQYRIYCSTILMAEVLPAYLAKTTYGNFSAFLGDFISVIVPISPDPIIMSLAGELRALPYKKNGERGRRLMTPDAIHLATAIRLKDTYGVSVDSLHTFDAGKVKGPEGRGIPMLGYEQWCEGIEHNPFAKRVIDLHREKPQHPSPEMPL